MGAEATPCAGRGQPARRPGRGSLPRRLASGDRAGERLVLLTASPVRVTGTWFRVARPAGDPLALTPEPADGRWQRGSVVRGLYLADSEATAWAEWYRHSAELGGPPQTRLPRAVYRFEVDVDDIADMSADVVLAADGIERLLPTRRQWPLTQPIGEAYWRAGRRGILVPSAAHVDGRALVVFRPTGEHPPGVEVLPRPRRYTELPALPTGLRT